ncbi:MAG: MoxR family ATPase [Candidatus Methanolliviera hydrocarbonicum]|uniref:MoxR family ATPase n=1 Tax=Candidatus Methanolliviera hydrocarbonicum TaxID=2491085 RepID=A0A520KVW2_9EURY|nr:MAG: MoxR family ATPase [Candidatus Methanolliviera hydrocarbonicum]
MNGDEHRRDLKVVLEGQYKLAYELLEDAVSTGLTPIVIGPPGVGKSLLVRKFAIDTDRPFYEVFFDELLRPAYLIGSFDPAIVLQKGYCQEAFESGHLLQAMEEGGIFLAQELNRAGEFCQNSLLEPLEERSYYVPKIGRLRADEKFAFIATANPAELAGTHQFSEALRDRLRVWIPLIYPDRETELKIIRVNCEPATIAEDLLDKIYDIVKAAREEQDLEMAVSIRAGISIARLAAYHLSQHGELDGKDLINYARSVLLGTSKGRGWISLEKTIDDVIRGALKTHV